MLTNNTTLLKINLTKLKKEQLKKNRKNDFASFLHFWKKQKEDEKCEQKKAKKARARFSATVSNVVIIHLYINLNDTTIEQHYYVQLLIKKNRQLYKNSTLALILNLE